MVELSLSQVLANLLGTLAPSFLSSESCRLTDISDRNSLATSCLWNVDLGWSKQATMLREKVLQTLRPLPNDFVIEHLKHLRLVDKKITCVDVQIKQLRHLTDLIITGNYIKEVDASHLPEKLEVLELCYNQIESLLTLNSIPLSCLRHLGCSYNHIEHLDMKPTNWKQLLSLDLSFNAITDLVRTVDMLSHLPLLRSLLLKGNPCALGAGYIGYAVDSLPNLTYLDQTEVGVMRDKYIGFQEKCHTQTELLRTVPLTVQVANISSSPFLNLEENLERKLQCYFGIASTFLSNEMYIVNSNIEMQSQVECIKQKIFEQAKATQSNLLYLNPVEWSGEMSAVTISTSVGIVNLVELHQLLKNKVNVRAFIVEVEFTHLVADPLSSLVASKDSSPESKSRQHSPKSTVSGRSSGKSIGKKGKPLGIGAVKTKGEKKKTKLKTASDDLEGWDVNDVRVLEVASQECNLEALLDCTSELQCKIGATIKCDEFSLIQMESEQDNPQMQEFDLEFSVQFVLHRI